MNSFSSNDVLKFSFTMLIPTALPLCVVFVTLATEDRFLDWLYLKGVVLLDEWLLYLSLS